MDAALYILLGLLVLSVPLAMAEMLLLFTMWAPYLRLVGRPVAVEDLPPQPRLDATSSGDELMLRRHGDELLFRRTFGFGRGRPMYAGVISRGAGGQLAVRAGAAPSGFPIAIAFGAFGGLTFGGGSLIVAAILGGLFSLVLWSNRRSAMKVFDSRGVPALREALR